MDAAGDLRLTGFYPPQAPSPRSSIPGGGTGGTHIRTEILDVGQVGVVDGTASRISHLRPTSAPDHALITP
ncbi:hypothetical protein [Streptomyces sp. NBC_00572]|uniref:hypothetical protein n=1 Tax=Streptomyces sp. NBC_00572 TaxID=2903664 RepID=UPI002251A2C0|nr:hypothetical protein [Streptomyces sp. NBC_00572]MCX4985891.1 hypothetical protein [Streptomyces sp. NBC_00572]